MADIAKPFRQDGFMNLLNKFGTSRDATEQYHFVPDGDVPDDLLTAYYEGNGLFAKIIDTPAADAVRHGFTLRGVSKKQKAFYEAALDELDWEQTAETAVKWSRLFGGALAVMLINDGHGLEEPLDWKSVRSIDDIRIYDRSIIQPDYSSIYCTDPATPFATRGSRLGMPERYTINSLYGSFTVHESRCLVFYNGILPERTTSSLYQFWGIPEYLKIHRAIRDAEVAHGSAVRMLDRAVQPVYRMKDLSSELATDEGENNVLRRLQVIDMARGMLNTIAIDAEGEDYDFRTFQFSGVSDVIDATCNYLSAVTSIPQTVLFGRSPAGFDATGVSDLEIYYNKISQIQELMLKGNLRYLLSVIFRAGIATGEVDTVPPIQIEFAPLWSLSEQEKADLDLKKAQREQTQASVIIAAVQEGIIDRQEARRRLVEIGGYQLDVGSDETGIVSPAAPTATKLPEDMSTEERYRIGGRNEI